MTHAEMDELYELYVLGVLEPAESAEIAEHLETQCAYCTEHVQAALAVASAMSGMVDLKKPPARLRARVIASVRPPSRPRAWIFAVGALSAACAILLALMISSETSTRSYQTEIAGLLVERNQLREAVEILSQSETRTVQFGVANNTPHGRVFVNRNQGLVFVGSRLPQVPADRTFQLWLIPATGAPQSAGLFRPNATGNFVSVRNTPVNTAQIHAVAVSIEPRGGSPAPTTKPILIVPLA